MAVPASIESFLDAWFGLRERSAERIIAESGFTPDPRSAYCSRCGSTVGEGETTARGCASCRGEKLHFDSLIRLGTYENELRGWILNIKYERRAEMGRLLGRMLGDAAAGQAGFDRSSTIAVPVPMPWQRRMYRGIDHARVIADGLASTARIDRFSILSKSNGPTQLSLSATDRRRNMRDRMRIRRRLGGWPLDHLHVILVDDVKTTGATLNAASRLLKDLGAGRITAAVLAAADQPGRRARDGEDGKAGRSDAPQRTDVRCGSSERAR